MAEPPQAGSIVRREDAGGPPERRSVLSRLGLGEEPSKAAPYLRAILAGLKDAGVPFFSGIGAALLELSSEEDDAVFEKRLTEILDTGRQSREMLEIQGDLSTAILLQQNVILARLESIGLPARREQLTSAALSMALEAYRRRVALDYQYADHRGIEGVTRAEHTASLPLDEVYVLPRLVPERDRFESHERESQLLKDLLDNEDLPPSERGKREEEFAILTGERWRAGKEKASGKSIGEALASTRHAVVIGSPGVGKSAMTRFLARTCALGETVMQEKLGWSDDLIPVVLPLAAYADAWNRQSGLTLQQHLENWLKERGGDALRAAVCAELQAGRILILFDGVDEIPDSRERVLVVRAVEGFLADHATNRFLVTSRPYGYVRLAGEIAHFQLPNFSPEQVGEFVRRWQRAFERWRHPEAPDLAQADKQAGEMLEEIRRNPKVEELATNPLMLVIFALIRHEQARLPEERVQLYNRAVNTLMDSWNRGRCLAGIDVGGARLPLDRLVRVWSAVAEWTRRTKPTGVVHRAELKTKLIEILRDEELDEDNPEATADSYLNAAADRAGLLEERGKDIFAFWHPTFEEFLAAVELTTPSSQAINRILPLRDDPRWREVILLAVGYLGVVQRDRETATELVREIWKDSPGPLEPLLHSHLSLAAACVADDVGVKRSLAEEMIVALGQVVLEFPYQPYVKSFEQIVRGLPRLRLTLATVRALEPLVSHSSPKVRQEFARLVSNVASESSQSFNLCELLARDSRESVRCHAAFGLLRAGVDSTDAWSALSVFQRKDLGIDDDLRAWLESDLGRVDRLLRSLLAAADQGLRWKAISILKVLRQDLVLACLKPYAENPDPDLRLRAASVLWAIKGSRELVFAVLDPFLASSDLTHRWRAADLLRAMGGSSDKVLLALALLMESSNLVLRLEAASAWNAEGGDSGTTLAVLEAVLECEEELRDYSGQVLSALEPLLKAQNEEIRLMASSVWQKMGGASREIIPHKDPVPSRSSQSRGNYLEEALEQGLEEGRATVKRILISGVDTQDLLFLASEASRERLFRVLETLFSETDLGLLLNLVEVWIALEGDPDRILAALGPVFDSSDVQRQVRVAYALLSADSLKPVEPLVRFLFSKPWSYLVACQKLLDKEPLILPDSQNLADLIRVRPEDSVEHLETRRLLFRWLYARLEPGVSEALLISSEDEFVLNSMSLRSRVQRKWRGRSIASGVRRAGGEPWPGSFWAG